MSLFKKKRVYLDWASSAPVVPSAQLAFTRAVRAFGNPSSPHEEGVHAKALLEEARSTIARLMEVKTDGVIFTSGATEANNLALEGYVRMLGEKGVEAKNLHILYTPSAHASIRETAKKLGSYGMQVEELSMLHGDVDTEKLQTQLRPETKLVLLDAVCGETGSITDTRAVRTVLDRYQKEHIALHVDASQAPLVTTFDLTRLSADMVTLDAQKIGGVRGVGALCIRSHVKLAPILQGGGQEQGRRPGTEPVALCAAFAAALTEAKEDQETFGARARHMRDSLTTSLSTALSGMLVNEGRKLAPHILNLSFPGRDTDYAVMLLDKEGFAVATKSACETDAQHGSRAILAFTGDEERSRSTLRISWGPSTTQRDLDRFAQSLVRTIRFLDGASV